MTTRFIHVGLSVRGAIRTGAWRHELVGALSVNGKPLAADEIFEELCNALAAGREMLQIGGDCDNFDDKTGCRGHDVVDASPQLFEPAVPAKIKRTRKQPKIEGQQP